MAVLKLWASRQRARWLTAIAAAVLVLAIVVAVGWALFVPLADALAHHDVGSAKGSLLQTARDAARGRLLTLAAGVFAAGALAFTARTFYLSQRTFELTEQGQVTDRYTRAIEQLGSDKLDVRIGGIYALERIARDSPRDHPTVMEVLTAFIREHSREPLPPPDPGGQERERSTRPDVQAAVTVVARRDEQHDIVGRGIDLVDANLTGARLGYAKLTGAYLDLANFTGARLGHANLVRAYLHHTDLTGAYLAEADLTVADLGGADLGGANLVGARLGGADLTGANLDHADLTGADLTGAYLRGAKLDDADLTGAKWPVDAPIPEGWKRDPSSGRLKTTR